MVHILAMVTLYTALGFMFVALAWRTGKHNDVPYYRSRYQYPARRPRPARPRVIIMMSSQAWHSSVHRKSCSAERETKPA